MARSVVPRARRVSIRFLDRTEREFIIDDARPLQVPKNYSYRFYLYVSLNAHFDIVI